MKHLPPTTAQKLSRVLEFYHHRAEPQLTLQAFATVVGQTAKEMVPVELLEDAQSGALESFPAVVADAICDTIGVDRDYLRVSGGKDIDIDQRLRLWILIRDRGLNHFAARSANLTRAEFEQLIAQVSALAPASDVSEA